MIKTFTIDDEKWRLVPVEPTAEMVEEGWYDAIEHEADNIDIHDIAAIYRTMIAAAPQPEQVDSDPVPDFRGYAALGTGQYLLNACPATEDLPAELVISIATEEEKAGRVIGDLKDVEPGTEIDPSSMAVRLAFFSVAGLDALEQQLRILREESFPSTTPQPDRTAELEAALKVARDALNRAADKFHDYAEIHAAKEASPENDVKVERNLALAADMDKALAKINEVLKP